jgi:hypothetical protein
MPKRTDSLREIYIEFLPSEIVKRINEIFDLYFGLGFKKNQFQLNSEMPKLVPKISTLSSTQVGDLHGEFASWLQFTGDKIKYYKVAQTVLEGEIQKTEERHLGIVGFDKGNIEVKKAYARSQSDYVTLYDYLVKLRSLVIMLEKEWLNLERVKETLSREISRREHNAGF